MSVLLDKAKKLERNIVASKRHFVFKIADNQSSFDDFMKEYEALPNKEQTELTIFKLF